MSALSLFLSLSLSLSLSRLCWRSLSDSIGAFATACLARLHAGGISASALPRLFVWLEFKLEGHTHDALDR
jgi:hypothetical protein